MRYVLRFVHKNSLSTFKVCIITTCPDRLDTLTFPECGTDPRALRKKGAHATQIAIKAKFGLGFKL